MCSDLMSKGKGQCQSIALLDKVNRLHLKGGRNIDDDLQRGGEGSVVNTWYGVPLGTQSGKPLVA